MIFDATSPDRARFAEAFDYCVVGTGPAGMTVARRLAASGAIIALMEGGGETYSDESQDLYRGRMVGLDDHPPDVSRLRYLGGSSNHWGGACRELDAHDFEARPHLPMSGWPIGKGDLDPYQPEVDEILGLPGPAGFPDQPMRRPDGDFRLIRYRHSRPQVRFGEKYRDELARSEHIHLALNANLVDLRLDGDLRTVTEAVFRSLLPGDEGFAVRARAFVLCAGGLENPRILLNACNQIPVGLGNEHDLVGRFFCEHPWIVGGDILFRDPFAGPDERYAPTPAFMAEHEVGNFAMIIEGHRPAGMQPLSLPKEVAREVACLAPFTERLARAVIGPSLPCKDGLGIRAYLARRRMPEDFFGTAALQTEQVPDPANRVRLGPERDTLGLQRLVLDWRLRERDRRLVRTAMVHFGMLLADQDLGRLRLKPWLLREDWEEGDAVEGIAGSNHHMCTTRMSDDPRQGVVDRNCRVHGLANLYLGGSSVFATAGHATPTYTILQLALRLGDHLRDARLG